MQGGLGVRPKLICTGQTPAGNPAGAEAGEYFDTTFIQVPPGEEIAPDHIVEGSGFHLTIQAKCEVGEELFLNLQPVNGS